MSMGSGFDDYSLIKIAGMTAPEFHFQTEQNPLIAGTTVVRVQPMERIIEVTFGCKADKRQLVNGFFNPFCKGNLTITWNGVTYRIGYVPEKVNIRQDHVYNSLLVTVSLFCADPYFNSLDDYGKNIAERQALVAFPFVMQRHGLVADYRKMKIKVPIHNYGDVDTPIRIEMLARGEVHNPSIILDVSSGGKSLDRQLHISMGGELRDFIMQSGDRLTFDTNPKNISVTLNGEDVLNFTDPSSDFFQVPTGESFIEYRAEAGAASLDVTVFYTPRYLGI